MAAGTAEASKGQELCKGHQRPFLPSSGIPYMTAPSCCFPEETRNPLLGGHVFLYGFQVRARRELC